MSTLISFSRFVSDLPWIAKAPWRPSPRLSIAARLFYVTVIEWLQLPVKSASPTAGISVRFSNFSEYLSLYREIFIKQEYALELSSAAPLILDCGANIGLATLYFKLRFPSARIIAFEPNPYSFQRLVSNMEANGLRNLDLRNEALGGDEGTVALLLRKGTTESHAASTVICPNGNYKSIPVTCTRLSRVMELLQSVDLVKIDIEGAEYEVLTDLERAGCLGRISSFIIEYHERIASAPIECALSLLRRNGFTCRLGAEWRPWYSPNLPYAAMIYAVREEQLRRDD